jgi:DNA replication protein DnaC
MTEFITAGLPPRFADRTLDGFEATSASSSRALAAARRMADRRGGTLVLAGPTGVGKTHLAAAVARAFEQAAERDHRAAVEAYTVEWEAADPPMRHLVRRPAPPRLPEWVNVADAIVRVRLEFGLPGPEREVTARVIRLHQHDGLVVLDDLGREKSSDWTGELVYALVNARYESQLPTIVTTNLTSAELGESPYWPAISRLAEDGELVRIDAPDRRMARP